MKIFILQGAGRTKLIIFQKKEGDEIHFA